MTDTNFTLIDSHCHLPLIEADEDGQDALIARAREAGVAEMLCVSVDLESFPGVAAVAARVPCVHASVGVHPNTEAGAEEPSVARLVELAETHAVVAIGETGLDYFRSSGDLDWQRTRFRTHIAAARECRRPLIVHCREAASDVIRVLREERADEVGGVMHCFVEDWETASAALDLGFYISLSGIVTFKTATELQAVAKRLPLAQLLVETDSPWLAPVPRRGQRNEPAYVRHTADFLAVLREESPQALAAATTQNFHRLFSTAATARA